MSLRNYSSTAGLMVLQASISSSATSIQVDTIVGLPVAPFVLVLDPGTSLEEIVDCSAVAGTQLTITRGVDGSPAQAHSTGASVRHMAIARDYRESNTHINSNTGVHGVAGSVVGTTDTQTLSNKDLSSATNIYPATLATTANLNAHTGASSAVHGVAGAVVGTTDTQTLTNKTLGATTFTGTVTGVDTNFSGNVGAYTTTAAKVTAQPLADTTPVVVKAFSGQTQDLAQIYNKTGSLVTRVDASGNVLTPNLPTQVQYGNVSITLGSGASSNNALVSFPNAFPGQPTVFVSIGNAPGGSQTLVARSFSPTTTNVSVALYTGNFPTGVASACTVVVNWMAVY